MAVPAEPSSPGAVQAMVMLTVVVASTAIAVTAAGAMVSGAATVAAASASESADQLPASSPVRSAKW
ncbi:MAG: hypothetical protein IPH86_07490 [bacterium]|nr:hypothetical protein [bacterium]